MFAANPATSSDDARSHAQAEPRASGSAFTLIELLVAIAIIAILASLLLPALGRAKGAAVSTDCRNNLRTMALAMQMYVGDFNAYPPTFGVGIMGFGEKYGWLMEDDWKVKLVPFIGVRDDRFPDRADTMRVLRCPQVVANVDGKRGQGQYALNASGTARFKDPANLGLGGYSQSASGPIVPTSESRVVSPASLIAVGDVQPGPTMGDMFWTSGHFDPCTTDAAFRPGTSHHGAANLNFVDGHVESTRPTNWIAATDTARRRWNSDQEPHPETWGRP